ncbi:Eco57I restriction-modification methylase domain-containing protein [Capnocytophaga sp. Marseille-Q4570]|uniref:site-specific DNA-methyltransferase (adenine-specific) n=1 Tax=Capnocytophaga bilenii TaxID=2819369 RepID=A0ABS3PYX8_9FLAO|nr:DNA methyltransferase [Capnocytophaga bilenii]MBO1884543.1 Eco57I restriction-modification methylase domain-containing protein [Capnocytophaga bilenii]
MTYAYEDTDRKEWRFSFISKNTASEFFAEAESKETNPRKYTYVFGTDELHTTAVERFFTLQQSNFEVKDFFAAFEVEALNKEFFEEYKAIYEDFVEHITGKRFVKEKGKWVEKEKHLPDPQYLSPFGEDDKCVRDYVKKLLGRLVFLYFLQKKEWLNGDVNYLKNLFGKSDKTSFLEEVLEPLFFGVLNTKPEDRRALFEAEQWNLSLLKEWEKVPYLNGGLFERDIIDNERVIFSEELFERTFEFFSRYNFTIDENDPEDTQIGIDPEMLGKIFENLLEDNKDKGAFYTPKEIVQYMCRESLIAYLTEKHKEEEVNIRNLVEKHNTKWEEDTCKKVLNSLKEVKICDPAIGSGAFPMGMLNELYKCRIALGEEKSVNIKKEILQNNIYGVDIEKGAVDIARLRFWLALVVDETIPEPLPNLDFKIMQGNSLLESYQGVDLSNLTTENNNLMLVENSQKDLFGNYVEPQLKITFTKKDFTESLQQDIKKYFSVTDAETKKRLRKQINNKIQEHIDYNLELRRNHLERLKLEITPKYKNDILTLKQEREKESLEQEIAKLDISRKEIIKLQETDEKPFFLWHIYFADVFKGANNLNNSGFDIVIGNPPYIDSEAMVKNGQEAIRNTLSIEYDFCKGNWDIYIAFFEKGFKILNEKGILTYITPDKWTSKPFGYELRKELFPNFYRITECGRNIFESANVDAIITFLTKKLKKEILIDIFAKENIINFSIISKEIIKEPYSLDWLFSKNISIINKVDSCIKIFSDYWVCENACATSDAYKIKPYISDTKYDSSRLKIINTGTIGRFISKWGEKTMTYLKDKYQIPTVNKEEFSLNFKNSYGMKSYCPKIIIKGLTLLDACIDKEGIIIPGKSTLVITSDTAKELFFPLALINSKFSIFYITEKYRGSSYNQGINFNPEMINNLPIPLIEKDILYPFITLVTQILNAKEKDSNFDTIDLENQIDILVYKLYNLTYEEVKIIDPNIESIISKEEYEAKK